MKLIIGLGNPEEKYTNNRHNVGYLFIDELKKEKNLKGIIALKTNTFMNSSGEAVKREVGKRKASMDDLYIVHDDLDIPLGSFKIQKGVGPRLHNGLSSIESLLGSSDFNRIRIGVDNRKAGERTPGEEYVLQDFSPDERLTIDSTIKLVIQKLIHGQ
jgi:peptidyl-tRNA hydrolase, PTH1 family